MVKEYTVYELISLLESGQLSSYDLTLSYIEQITTHDAKLNAVAMINPHALDDAKSLDEERKQKGPRSPLHGIPILLKDNINTLDDMPTTANSFALKDLHAPYEATIVKKLKAAGVIILGKANLSEFAYFMSYDKMPSGFGSLNGQVKSPYHKDIDPLGSSTGSAVAVAANLIPFSIGTETNGSLMAPAYQNSIVSIKPTIGLVSRYGIIPISPEQDTAGPMAKTVMECALLLDAIVGSDVHDAYTKNADQHVQSYASADQIDVSQKRIGILKFTNYPYDEEDMKILNELEEKFSSFDISVQWYDFELVYLKNDESLLNEFKYSLNAYLQSVAGFTKMTSLSDIITFNREHSERCLKFGQSILEAADLTPGDLNDPTYLQTRSALVAVAKNFEELMVKDNLDALVSTKWVAYGPIYGNPSVCVPGKALTDDKPKSVVFVGKKWDERVLIAIAHLYEKLTKHRVPPLL